MTVALVIADIQATVGAIDGIRSAPAYPPDQINVYPTAVCYPSTGTWSRQADWKKGLHTVTLEIHWARKDLYRDVERCVAFAESVPNALLDDPTLGGQCDTVTEIGYAFGAMQYGGIDTIGYRYSITFKDQTAIT